MASCVASSDRSAPSAERIAAAAGFMAARSVYGLAWLDTDLRVTARYGDLVAEVPLGEPITASLLALIGLEDEIAALREAPDRSVALPAVKVQGHLGEGLRINLAVHWMPDEAAFLVVVSKAAARSNMERAYLAESRLRRMAETELAAQVEITRRTNRELAIANRDLEEFAYVISHDLRAPLRGLRYAATNAQAAVAAGDGDAAELNLVKVIHRSRRMSAMLTGLLEYSRIGRKLDAAAPLDVRALAEEIAETSSAGTGCDVRLEGTWPVIVTVSEPLDIVLRNLVDNAVKHHDREQGLVILRCDDEGERLLFTITDDGPGIAPEWHAAVFEPFKQIGDSDEADSSGIGLALVKKTVERLGGTIELQSDPASRRGTTFRVGWPKVLGQA